MHQLNNCSWYTLSLDLPVARSRANAHTIVDCVLQVWTAYAAVTQLNRELLELQRNNAEFGAALEAVGTRGELAEVKRR